MKKILFFSLILFLASCDKDDPSNNGSKDLVEIKTQARILDILTTKTPSDEVPDGARVVVTTTSGNYTALYKNGTMPFAGIANNVVGFDGGAVYFPSSAPQIYLAGFNPAFNWTFAGSSAGAPIDGSTDLLGTLETPTNRLAASQGIYPTLDFRHILTQLIVSVSGDANAATAWGTITSISLSHAQGVAVKKGIQFDIISGVTIQDDAAADGPLPFAQITGGTTFTDNALASSAIAITTTPTAIGYTLCTPVPATDTSPEYTLFIVTSNRPAGTLIPINLKQQVTPANDFTGTTQGFRFTISLTFVSEEIKAQATIQPWLDGGTGIGDVI